MDITNAPLSLHIYVSKQILRIVHFCKNWWRQFEDKYYLKLFKASRMPDIHDRQPMSKLRFCQIFTTTNSHMLEQKNIQILLRLCGSACKSEYASDMSKVFFAAHCLVCSKLKRHVIISKHLEAYHILCNNSYCSVRFCNIWHRFWDLYYLDPDVLLLVQMQWVSSSDWVCAVWSRLPSASFHTTDCFSGQQSWSDKRCQANLGFC